MYVANAIKTKILHFVRYLRPYDTCWIFDYHTRYTLKCRDNLEKKFITLRIILFKIYINLHIYVLSKNNPVS